MVKILGIDPGSKNLGWCLMENDSDKCGPNSISVKRHGVLNSASKNKIKRILKMKEGLYALVQTYSPDEMVYEDCFVGRFQSAVIALGQIQGVLISIAGDFDIPIYSYTTASCKKAMTGRGNASKNDVMEVVRRNFLNGGEIEMDASDAVAVAYCRSARRGFGE